MKRQQIVLILVAAMLCVASTVLAHEGMGRVETTLIMEGSGAVGTVYVYNNGKKIIEMDGVEYDIGSKLHVTVEVDPAFGWFLTNAQVYAGFDPVPTKKGAVQPGKFPYKVSLDETGYSYIFYIDLADFDITWGQRTGDPGHWFDTARPFEDIRCAHEIGSQLICDRPLTAEREQQVAPRPERGSESTDPIS